MHCRKVVAMYLETLGFFVSFGLPCVIKFVSTFPSYLGWVGTVHRKNLAWWGRGCSVAISPLEHSLPLLVSSWMADIGMGGEKSSDQDCWMAGGGGVWFQVSGTPLPTS